MTPNGRVAAKFTGGVTRDGVDRAIDQIEQAAAERGAPWRARLLGWLAMAAVLVAALAIGVADDGGPRTPEERLRNLAETVACPACDGQSVAESDAAASAGSGR